MDIDIHNHGLYGVDDGARSYEESVDMLREARNQNVGAIILTPHYRRQMFPYPIDQIEEHYERLKKAADEIGISLYLGCEYHVDSRMVDALYDGIFHTLADRDYVLMEYSYDTEYTYIVQNTRKIMASGYLPVIAHVERYGCLVRKPALCAELSEMGAMIQVNADSVLGDGRWPQNRMVKKLLKNGWVDVIGSDAHGVNRRASHMAACRAHIEKKYGQQYADLLFEKNPYKILGA